MIELTTAGAGYGRRKRRIDPLLISFFQVVLGLTGAATLILFFYTGSFSAAGEWADATINTVITSIASFLPW
ncbi:hypothetical protein [Asticcacaulis tiandongensis]|uniref:hypothetical protein n=1 Tax=Asticcacaulis tiandongensis TaxID=2565365 RepID=UPI001127867B|nr:hypothetical protein [Asticcacaulis tiandongensis]